MSDGKRTKSPIWTVRVARAHWRLATGLVVGAYRVRVEHWTKRAAYQEMKAHGFHSMLRGLYSSWQGELNETACPVSPPRDVGPERRSRPMKTTHP